MPNLTTVPVAAPLYLASLEPAPGSWRVVFPSTKDACEEALTELREMKALIYRVYAMVIDLDDEDLDPHAWVCGELTFLKDSPSDQVFLGETAEGVKIDADRWLSSTYDALDRQLNKLTR